jgi:hypothetical protein
LRAKGEADPVQARELLYFIREFLICEEVIIKVKAGDPIDDELRLGVVGDQSSS